MMKFFGCFLSGSFLFLMSFKNDLKSVNSLLKDSTFKSYLALGDSYTIGESVDANENFPNQLVSALRSRGLTVKDPEIRAVTGWTTGNLISSLRTTAPLQKKYDLVTLLIGVNNQYQGRTLNEYSIEFRYLLNECISLAGDKSKVIVISIPDYSITAFAAGGDLRVISREIRQFNTTQKKICAEAGVKFINITGISLKGKKDASMQADDGLHPSAKQYAEWTALITPVAAEMLEKEQKQLNGQ